MIFYSYVSSPEGKPPFSYGFPLVFPLKHPFSHGFPMVFPLKPPFSDGFPMVSLCFWSSHIFSFLGASGVDQPPLSREVLGESRVAATIPGAQEIPGRISR